MEHDLNILIVEDSEDDALLLVRHLERNGFAFRHRRVETRDELAAALREGEWDTVLCDYKLPQLDAQAVLREVRAKDNSIPIILVSGSVGEETLAELFHAGAQDFVTKNNLARLRPALVRGLEIAAAQRERKRMMRELEAKSKFLDAVLENAQVGIVACDAEGRLTVVNRAMRQIHGIPAGKIRVDTWADQLGLFSSADGTRLAGNAIPLLRALGGERLRYLDVTISRQGLPTRDVVVNGDALITDDGEKLGAVLTVLDETEKRQKDAALRHNEQQFRQAFETTVHGMCITRLDGRFLMVNEAFRTLVGYGADECRDLNFWDLTHPDDWDISAERIQQLLTGEIAYFELEKRYIRKDGTTIPVLISVALVRDDAGEPSQFITHTMDLTALKKAERALEARRKFSQTVLDNIADAVITISTGGEILSFNQSAEEIFGYSEGEVIGRNVNCLMPSDIASQHDGYIANYLSTGVSKILGVAPREVVGLRKDGSIVPLELKISEAELDGRMLFIGTTRDLTEEKAAEHAIRESNQRFAGAFATAPHGMALVAPDGRWLEVNRALCDMLGYTEAELLATNFQAVTHPDDLDAHRAHVRRLIEGTIDTYKLEKRYISKDGREIEILASVSVVRDEHDEPEYFVCQIFDLSERKEIEAQLLQARKMEAMGQLTGGVAHDFNNLLTIILGNAQLIARRAKDNEQLRKRADAISASAKRGAKLVQDLMAFSRKQSLDPSPINVHDLLRDMLDMLQRSLTQLVSIELRLAEDLHCAYVDPGQLENAILNLAVNARDAMPGGGTLTIAAENIDLDSSSVAANGGSKYNRFVRISITDTGTGIPRESIERIFEPFFTTKDVGKGTGLGLAMVHGFINQSGGQIKVESSEGEGTTFHLYLPTNDKIDKTSTQANGYDHGLPRGDETILIVEDEPSIREFAVAVLQDLGYRTVEAQDGHEAIAALESRPDVDLLFTDIVMPGGITGAALGKMTEQRWPQIKVLYTSGYKDATIVGGQAGDILAPMLSKPYDDIELARRIRFSLDA